MIDWSVMGKGGYPRAARTVPVICAGLCAGLVSKVVAMVPPAGLSRSAAEIPSGDWHRTKTEAYVMAAGGVLPSSGASTVAAHRVVAIPAFARKYGLACSACHTAWPQLNAFGQTFKDNGYQLGNDRDSPIWVNPSYIPIAVRTTPRWRLESTTHQPVDLVPGDPTSGTAERTVKQSGFDIGGADLLMLGTLYKNVTFGFVPVIDAGGVAIEAAFVRLDNLFKSRWANLKVGKFELDNLLSEKRVITLSNNGGFYQSYHFLPAGDMTNFALGDNQIGAEWMGHSVNSYTRFSVAVLSSTNGVPGLPAGRGYDGSFTLSQAFDAGRLGLQRVGVYAYAGHRPTVFESIGGSPVLGTGTRNKSFYRVGATGDFFLGKLQFLPLVMHASDDKYLSTATHGNQPLPVEAQNARWNSMLLETHYYVSPQLIFTQRSEIIRMSSQPLSSTPKTLGNIDAFTFGYRWYPIMFSRAGLAVVGELSFTKTIGTVPLSGNGVGLPPLSPATAVRSTSLFFALDFAF